MNEEEEKQDATDNETYTGDQIEAESEAVEEKTDNTPDATLEKNESKKEHQQKRADKHRHTSKKSQKKSKADKRTVHEKRAKELTIKIKKKTAKKLMMAALTIILLGIAVFALAKIMNLMPPTNTNTNTTGKTTIEFYVMSKCPYGVQVEDAIKPVLDKFGDNVDFSINFIANENTPGNFESLHGSSEVNGNIIQLCAMKYEPKKYMELVVCMNENAQAIPNNWEECAANFSLDKAKIKTCYDGAEGKLLLSESIKKTDQRGATGSPTIYINNQEYNSGRDPASFTRAICVNLQGNPECANLPACSIDTDCPQKEGKVAKCTAPNTKEAKCEYSEPVEVGLTVLSDKKCASCDPTRIVAVSKQLFPGVKVTYVDSASPEGKKLVDDLKLVYAPAYIFDSRLEKTESWTANTQLRNSFEKIGDKYKIIDTATGASYFLSEEARKKSIQEKGIVLGDNKPQIDFFIMSYCPYGNQAEEAIEPVYQLLKSKAIFNPRYVIYANYQGGTDQYCMDSGKLCSMHGIQELHQDVRELCVNKYLGTASLFKFMLEMNKKCTSQNADSCWEDVAKGLGLDTAKIKTCEKDEALTLLREEKSLNDAYKVSGSPTVFIDGESYSGARTAEGFKTALCNAFDTPPAECQSALSSGEAAAPTGGCG